jgi:cytochrome c oxidase subunit 4
MQAATRLARHRALRGSVRLLATTANANNAVHVTSYTSTASSSAIPLSNVEAQWEKMSSEEQLSVYQQLEELQKKNWKELSLDEKKAGACVSFADN